MRQRVGERYSRETPPVAGSPTAPGGTTGPQGVMWGRIEGEHTRVEPDHSTTGSRWQADQFKMQAGLDGLFVDNGAGRLFGGFTFQYSQASASVRSFYGNGRISTEGYSLGATLSWLGSNGFYVDAQTQMSLYSSKLRSGLAGRLANSNSALGYAVGVEAGQRFALDGDWSLTPQAQLVYSSIDVQSFTDRFGARVKLGKGDSLTGRLGLAIDYRSTRKDEDGRPIRSSLYGIANLYHEFLDKTDVSLSGTRLRSTSDQLWGSIGLGGALSWDDDRIAIFGEVSARASLANLSDSYSYKGTAGLRIRW